MADAKDILGIDRSSAHTPRMSANTLRRSASGSATKSFSSKSSKKKKKVPRMLRELTAYHEGGVGLAPLVPAPSDGFRTRRRARRVAWVWKPFKNSARKDGAMLYHWAKRDVPADDYPFARFNVAADVVSYTDAEYSALLSDDDRWTREMTDRLIELCKRFDLRFHVVADRFEPSMDVEAIKDRYYTIARKLLLASNEGDPAAVDGHPLIKHPYDAEYERKRKARMEKLMARTPEEVEEERYLVAELKKFQHHRKKAAKEAAKAAKSLAAAASAKRRKIQRDKVAAAAAAKTQAAAAKGPVIDNPAYFSEDNPRNTRLRIKFRQGKPVLVQVAPTGRRRMKQTPTTASRRKRGVHARSAEMATALPCPATMLKDLQKTLDLHNIPKKPMATSRVVATFNSLRQNVLTSLRLKDYLTKKTYEVELLRARKAVLISKGNEAGDDFVPGADPDAAAAAATAGAAAVAAAEGREPVVSEVETPSFAPRESSASDASALASAVQAPTGVFAMGVPTLPVPGLPPAPGGGGAPS